MTPARNESRGQRLVAKWLDAKGKGAAAVMAKALGVSPASVTHWKKATQRPRDEQRRKLALYTEGAVPADSWLSQAERKAIAEVRPAA